MSEYQEKCDELLKLLNCYSMSGRVADFKQFSAFAHEHWGPETARVMETFAELVRDQSIENNKLRFALEKISVGQISIAGDFVVGTKDVRDQSHEKTQFSGSQFSGVGVVAGASTGSTMTGSGNAGAAPSPANSRSVWPWLVSFACGSGLVAFNLFVHSNSIRLIVFGGVAAVSLYAVLQPRYFHRRLAAGLLLAGSIPECALSGAVTFGWPRAAGWIGGILSNQVSDGVQIAIIAVAAIIYVVGESRLPPWK